jgi:hypothetical protein
MKKHPSQTNLALFAGGELGRWTRWSVGRHVGLCDDCRRDISDFSALRAEAAVLAELPDVSWDAVAADMKANIRLGLAAGECVSPHPVTRMVFSPRALAACVSLAALLVVSVFLERPAPRGMDIEASESVLETNAAGIQLREGTQGIVLFRHADKVNDLATGRAMQQSYVDSETHLVTINNVYVE